MDDFRNARWYAVRRATSRKPASYRCPLCDEALPALMEHVLVVPEGDPARRRHAHTECVINARRAGRLPLREEVGGEQQGRADGTTEHRSLADRLHRRRQRHLRRSRPYRAAFAAGGFGVVLAGIMMLPFPPFPGVPVILVGVGMLALEFGWAERLLGYALRVLPLLRARLRQVPSAYRAGGAAGLLLIGAGVVALLLA